MNTTVIAPATRRAADDAARELRRASGADAALVYRPHPSGGYAVCASAGRAPAGFHPRLWVDEKRWIALARHEHWLTLPLGHAGRTGLAVLGPFPEPHLGRRARRGLGRHTARIADMVNQASVEDGRNREHLRRVLDEQGSRAAGDLAALRETLASVSALHESGTHSARIIDECLNRLGDIGDVAPDGRADLAARLSALVALADAHDAGSSYMIGHADRVRTVAMATARAMNLPEVACGDVAMAARLHDCGEAIAVGGILDLPRLTDGERERLQDHPRIGATLTAAAGLPPTVQRAIETHHERWDGLGYPDGIAGTEIPVEGRVVALAEVFDALISPRPWRGALPFDEALDHIYDGRGTQFDPSVVEAFFVAWQRLAEEPEFRRR